MNNLQINTYKLPLNQTLPEDWKKPIFQEIILCKQENVMKWKNKFSMTKFQEELGFLCIPNFYHFFEYSQTCEER